MTGADESRPKVATTHETRTRVIDGGDRHWKVREEPCPTADRRSGSSLIFDAETVVRPVRTFPPDWYDWSDADLYSLCLRP
jgi:hypothetical protein